jgi:hypothetical protein
MDDLKINGTVFVERVVQVLIFKIHGVITRHIEVRGCALLGSLTVTLGQLPSNIPVVWTG